ncbi:MAG: hypothetical protein ACK47B_14320 [Armatimonadota bacterium]
MNRRWSLCAAALAAGLLFALPVSAQQVRAPQAARDPGAAAMARDSRLQEKISVELRETPLRDALSDLSKRLKLRLVTTGDTADEEVTLLVKDRPAAEVLTRLSEHFDYQWYRARDGYELTQNAGAKRREAALREADRSRQLARIQEQMERVAQLVGMPREQLMTRMNELDRKARDAAPEERAALQDELESLRAAMRPGAAACAALWRGLTPPQSAALLGSGELSIVGAGLAPGLADLVHQAADEMRTSGEVRVLGLAAPAPGTGGGAAPFSPENLLPVEAAAVIKLSQNTGTRFPRFTPGTPSLRLEFMLSSLRGDGNGRRSSFPVVWSPSLSDPDLSDNRQKTETDDPDLKKMIDLGAAPALPRRDGIRPVIVLGDGPPPGGTPLAAVLSRIHQETGLEVLADAYTRARLRLSGKKPVVEVLDAIAHDLGYEWSKEGKLLILRSSTWFYDRPMEVPARILTPWWERVLAAGAVRLDDLAQFAAALTDAQASGLDTLWTWYLEGTGIEQPTRPWGFFDGRHHLRFWASLLPQQRQVVLNGGILPVQQLSPLQAGGFTAAFHSQPAGPVFASDPQEATPGDLASGGFSLSVREMQQQAYTSEGDEGMSRIIVQGFAGADGQLRTPKLGTGSPLVPAGPPKLLDSYQFRYHVAGNEQPAKTVPVTVPRVNRPMMPPSP